MAPDEHEPHDDEPIVIVDEQAGAPMGAAQDDAAAPQPCPQRIVRCQPSPATHLHGRARPRILCWDGSRVVMRFPAAKLVPTSD